MFGPFIALMAIVILGLSLKYGLKMGAEGDHVADPSAAPWPYGQTVRVRMQAYVPNNANALIVDRYVLPFDAYVRRIYLSHKKFTVVLDSISMITKDAAKNVLGAVTPADDVDGVAQTVHADVANRAYLLNKGDIVHLKATSTTSNSGGWVTIDMDLEVAYFNTGRR